MNNRSNTQMILDAIPLDKWMSAKDLSKITGLNSHKIAALISFRLINTFVKRRSIRYDGGSIYEYRLLKMIKTDIRKSASVT